MGTASYLLNLKNGTYDKIISLAKRREVTIAQWLREAIKEKLTREQSNQ